MLINLSPLQLHTVCSSTVLTLGPLARPSWPRPPCNHPDTVGGRYLLAVWADTCIRPLTNPNCTTVIS